MPTAYVDPGEGSMTLQIVAIAVALAVALAVANYAKRKGRSFWGFFLLTFFFLPVGVIAVLVVKDKRAG